MDHRVKKSELLLLLIFGGFCVLFANLSHGQENQIRSVYSMDFGTNLVTPGRGPEILGSLGTTAGPLGSGVLQLTLADGLSSVAVDYHGPRSGAMEHDLGAGRNVSFAYIPLDLFVQGVSSADTNFAGLQGYSGQFVVSSGLGVFLDSSSRPQGRQERSRIRGATFMGLPSDFNSRDQFGMLGLTGQLAIMGANTTSNSVAHEAPENHGRAFLGAQFNFNAAGVVALPDMWRMALSMDVRAIIPVYQINATSPGTQHDPLISAGTQVAFLRPVGSGRTLVGFLVHIRHAANNLMEMSGAVQSRDVPSAVDLGGTVVGIGAMAATQ